MPAPRRGSGTPEQLLDNVAPSPPLRGYCSVVWGPYSQLCTAQWRSDCCFFLPVVDVVQGMNFVALALLEACDGDDENAFWILAGMCDRHDLEVRPAKSSYPIDSLVVAASKIRDNMLTKG